MPPLLRIAFTLALGGLAACRDSRPIAARPTVSVPDSVRARRGARLAVRPDTFGARVDSLRVAGSATAPAWIVVVTDFQCEECRRFAREVLPTVRRELVDGGAARLAVVNAPREEHFNARFAALAALCAAASDRYWPMHDTLFATQAAWARQDDPRPYFDSLAVAVGADAAVQQDCRERQRLLLLLTTDIDRSRAAGVSELPTVLVGSARLSGRALTLPEIRRALATAQR